MSNEAKLALVTALVLSPIRHNGDLIKPGDDDTAVLVEMTRKDFDHLAKFGAVAEVGEITAVNPDGSATPVDLDAEVAKAATEQIPAPPPDDTTPGPEAAAETQAAAETAEPSFVDSLATAIQSLGENDFTDAGKPKVAALEALMKMPVSAEQRDAAWELVSQNNPRDVTE